MPKSKPIPIWGYSTGRRLQVGGGRMMNINDISATKSKEIKAQVNGLVSYNLTMLENTLWWHYAQRLKKTSELNLSRLSYQNCTAIKIDELVPHLAMDLWKKCENINDIYSEEFFKRHDGFNRQIPRVVGASLTAHCRILVLPVGAEIEKKMRKVLKLFYPPCFHFVTPAQVSTIYSRPETWDSNTVLTIESQMWYDSLHENKTKMKARRNRAFKTGAQLLIV